VPLIVPDANGVLTLEGITLAGGRTYRLMAQRTPTADPLVGIALSDREGGLYLNGIWFPIPGGPLISWQTVRVLLQANALATRVGQGRYWITLLAGGDGWVWQVAASWEVEVDLRPFLVHIYTSRLADGTGVVLVLTPLEAPDRAELTLGDLRLSQTWEGFRRRRDGAAGFVFALPRGAAGEGRVRVYKGSRYGQGAFSLPPWSSPPERTPTWQLPFWLPQGQPPQSHILEGVTRVLPNGESLATQINPDQAQGRHLLLHASLFATPPDPEEPESSLHLRLKALPAQRYASVPALRAHLRALAQGGVAISDASSAEGRPLKLDGTWTLDGAQTLGGDPALTLTPGRYLVRLYDTPMPWPYYWKEIMRLRPAGLEPVLRQDVGGGMVRLGAAQVGAKEPALGPNRDIPLAGYRRLDGSWTLDGSVRLVSSMVVRSVVSVT
jgi:hypothetical protein